MRSFPFLAFALAAAVLALSACAGEGQQEDDQMQQDTLASAPRDSAMTGTAGSTADTVQVTLTNFNIDMPGTLPAGPTVFQVENAGDTAHNFEVEGRGMEEEFESNLQPGTTETLQVDLQPGSYEVYCPVADHEERGMELSLTVNAQGGGQ